MRHLPQGDGMRHRGATFLGGVGVLCMSRASTAQANGPGLVRKLSRTLEIAFTTLVAWFFCMAAAGALVYVASGLWMQKYESATPLSIVDPAITAAGGVISAKPFGLVFDEKQGAVMAAVYAAGSMLALGMSMMLSGSPRRLGLFLIVVWSGLWAIDAAMVVAGTWTGTWFAAGMPVVAGAAALIVVFGCMIHRALLLWRVQVTL